MLDKIDFLNLMLFKENFARRIRILNLQRALDLYARKKFFLEH